VKDNEAWGKIFKSAGSNGIIIRLDILSTDVDADGASDVARKEAGFVTSFSKHVCHTVVPLHRQALCGKYGPSHWEDIMNIVTKGVNLIV
jgi:hypothetical protein